MITRIHIQNFLGITAREYRFDKRGAVIEGANRSGKTSVLEAIRVALTGRGASDHAIRKGADEAEILLDLDDISVRRVITEKSSTVTVMREDGTRQKSPQAFLSELLGVAPLDPIELVFEKDAKKRRATILAALPCKLTPELVCRWIPDATCEIDTNAHGLEALEKLRTTYYDRRALANREAKLAGDEHARKQQAQFAMEGRMVCTEPPLLTILEAERLQREAQQKIANVTARAEAASAASDRASKSADRIKQLREKSADEHRQAAQTAVDPKELDADVELLAQERDLATGAAKRVADAEAALEIAQRLASKHAGACRELESRIADKSTRQAESQRHLDRAAELESRAAELESVGVLLELPEAIQAAADAAIAESEAADAMVVRAKQRVEYETACSATTTASILAKAAADKAEALDEVVRKLRNDAPAELLRAAGGVPGLSIDDDDIMLDGVALDRLSGAEQLRFAVQIARRLNEKSKLIIVDGLERLDAEQLPGFLEAATADGYQIIATRVGVGPAHAVKIGGAT